MAKFKRFEASNKKKNTKSIQQRQDGFKKISKLGTTRHKPNQEDYYELSAQEY